MKNEVKVSIRNLYKIFGSDPQAMLPLVKDGLSKTDLLEQHNHVLGLQDINIDIELGHITVIMGLSGSGKSTLIRHLNRLIEPTAGEICVDGEDVLQLDEAGLRELRQSRMSMVFQKFALFPHQTIIENAGLAWRTKEISEEEADAEASKWIDCVGLQGFENHYPHQLSGGMQQRVGLARALTSNSEIMLMDEAFSALDPLIRNNMQDLLIELQNDLNKTIIFITHDLDEALKLADHLVILKDGFVVQQGEPQYILLNPNDPYIEDFVSEINRARVLRVRSVMKDLPEDMEKADIVGTVDINDNLESVIALSGGDTSHNFLVSDGEKPVGLLDMKVLVKALVPRVQSTQEATPL